MKRDDIIEVEVEDFLRLYDTCFSESTYEELEREVEQFCKKYYQKRKEYLNK